MPVITLPSGVQVDTETNTQIGVADPIQVNPSDAPKIAEELNISLSAVYKTLVKLEELTLVEIEKFNFVDGEGNNKDIDVPIGVTFFWPDVGV